MTSQPANWNTPENSAAIQTILALRASGQKASQIVKDPTVANSPMMSSRSGEISRTRLLYDIFSHQQNQPTTTPTTSAPIQQAPTGPTTATTQHHTTNDIAELFDRRLLAYEVAVGNHRRRSLQEPMTSCGRTETIVISDLHVPDDREDLVAELITKHRGKDLLIAGDLFDFSALSRYAPTGWSDPGLMESMARGGALLTVLRDNFPSIRLMLGNHDARAWKKALNTINTEYGRLCHEWMIYALETKYGVKVIENKLDKKCGRAIEGLHFWHQQGDALITHFERSGAPVGKSSQLTFEFFRDWQEALEIEPFRVILQAHSHKASYHRSKCGKVHCYEIGCLCDWADYAVQGRPVYSPPQHAYFRLVQEDGITSINESQLVCLD